MHARAWNVSLVLTLAACGGDGAEPADAGLVHDASSTTPHDASSVPAPVDASHRDDVHDASAAVAAVDADVSDDHPLGAARCQGAGLALCDDFELGTTPDTTLWNVLTSYSGQPSTQNHVTLDRTHVARGSQALHVHTETNDPVYIETKLLPAQNDGFYMRAFAYFAVDPGARSKGHWGAFVGVGKQDGAGQDIEVRVGGQFDILVANYSPNDALQTSASRDGVYDDGTRLPIATWTCFEVQFDGAGQQLRVWMDGVEQTRLHVTDWNQFGHGYTPNWSPSYDRLRIGYQSWNADTPVDVWYDAVAIDGQRIGCDR